MIVYLELLDQEWIIYFCKDPNKLPFFYPFDEFKSSLDMKSLSNNVSFINSLSSLSLKKSQIQNSDDFESFINKPCKFMFIYDSNSNELENPEYILFSNME